LKHDAEIAWATERRLRDRLVLLEATATRSASETKATRLKHDRMPSPELAQAVGQREHQERLDRERVESHRLDLDLALAEAENLTEAARVAEAARQQEAIR
jgi:hypothetical protein